MSPCMVKDHLLEAKIFLLFLYYLHIALCTQCLLLCFFSKMALIHFYLMPLHIPFIHCKSPFPWSLHRQLFLSHSSQHGCPLRKLPAPSVEKTLNFPQPNVSPCRPILFSPPQNGFLRYLNYLFACVLLPWPIWIGIPLGKEPGWGL